MISVTSQCTWWGSWRRTDTPRKKQASFYRQMRTDSTQHISSVSTQHAWCAPSVHTSVRAPDRCERAQSFWPMRRERTGASLLLVDASERARTGLWGEGGLCAHKLYAAHLFCLYAAWCLMRPQCPHYRARTRAVRARSIFLTNESNDATLLLINQRRENTEASLLLVTNGERARTGLWGEGARALVWTLGAHQACCVESMRICL
jgi:hypothetical protein